MPPVCIWTRIAASDTAVASGLERLEAEARPGLEQREHPVGVVAERLAEIAAAVARRTRMHEGLEQEVLLFRLAQLRGEDETFRFVLRHIFRGRRWVHALDFSLHGEL